MPAASPPETTTALMVLEPAAVLRLVGPISNHGTADDPTVKAMSAPVLVTVKVACGLDADDTDVVKLRAIGLTTSSGLLLTYIVTGIVTGLFGNALPVAGLVAAIVTVPVQVVPLTMVPGATFTGKVDSPVPAVVVPTESQLVPQAAEVAIAAVAVKAMLTPAMLLAT